MLTKQPNQWFLYEDMGVHMMDFIELKYPISKKVFPFPWEMKIIKQKGKNLLAVFIKNQPLKTTALFLPDLLPEKCVWPK